MTATDALKILGLGPQNLEADEAVIRKAYFRMAQQVKNPRIIVYLSKRLSE